MAVESSDKPVDPSGLDALQEVPEASGEEPLELTELRQPKQGELSPADPAVIDMAAKELSEGFNRCPRCGATEVRHRAGSDRLVCLYCRHEWAPVRVEEAFGLGEGIADLRGKQIGAGARDINADAASLRTYECGGCGAEVVINTENALTARCHWCRHLLGVNEQIENGAVPDALLPFQIKEDDAVARIREFIDKRKFFAVKAFKEEFNPDNVVGVYLPYMIVDARASVDAVGVGEIKTRQYTVGLGKSKKTYYDADVWHVQRHVDFTVDDLALESSEHRANFDISSNTHNVINAVLPFDTKNAVQWNASYLVGYTAEKRDRDIQHLMPRLQDKMLSIARAQMLPSLQRYDRGVRWQQERVDLKGSRWVTMYLPVWLYAYHEKNPEGGLRHYIAVNGRTGKTMGSVPVQEWKLLLATLAIGIAIAGLPFLI